MTEEEKRAVLKKRWYGIKTRCFNSNNPAFQYYGGRGVTVCERWLSFENFYNDMASTFQEGLTIDRVDVNGNYEPSNCRWATYEEQANNKRKTRRVKYEGKEVTILELSRITGLEKRELKKKRAPFHSNIKSIYVTPKLHRRIIHNCKKEGFDSLQAYCEHIFAVMLPKINQFTPNQYKLWRSGLIDINKQSLTQNLAS